MRFLSSLLSIVLTSATLGAQNNIPKKMRLPAEIGEASGFCYAAPDSLWWHNDSGDQPRLILTDAKGTLKKQILLPVQHKDWEDITADQRGNLYIGDFGNNANQRKDLRIYIFNPKNNQLDSILFTYVDQKAFPPLPAQANFDMEGFFYYKDSLHLFSKNRLLQGNYYTKHYTLPAQPGNSVAMLRDSVQLKNRVVTAAAISPDGQTMALLAYYYKKWLNIFPVTRTTIYTIDINDFITLQGKIYKKRVGKFLIPTQYECLDFIDNQSVYIASERTPLFRPQARRKKLPVKSKKP